MTVPAVGTGRRTFVLVDGENIDATLGQILGRRPAAEERPRWERVTDYLAQAPIGAWLECRPVLLRRTSRLMFVEGRFEADGTAVLRASGVFSLPRPRPAPTAEAPSKN